MTVKIYFRMSLTVSLFLLVAISIAQAQYSGGSGTAEDPYQIATAADLIVLGETPDDYDKHFILTADIDLDPGLPGARFLTRPSSLHIQRLPSPACLMPTGIGS